MDSSKPAYSLKQALLGVLAAASLTPALAIDPLSAINMADPDIVQWKVTGVCKSGLLVQHRIPVGWAETSTDGKTFIDNVVQGKSSKSGMLRFSGLDTASEARAFSFSDTLWKMSKIYATHGAQMCSMATAWSPPVITMTGESADCASRAPIAAALLEQASLTAAYSATLLIEGYDSRLDPGWVSGCRDDAITKNNMAVNMRCTANNMSPNLVTNTAQANSAVATACLGNWGSMFPRQSRELGLTGAAASAKTVLRAMSTARDHFGTIPFPVNSNGILQQTMPRASIGFAPGTLPMTGTTNPQNKQYGWIYWRTVSCCVGL